MPADISITSYLLCHNQNELMTTMDLTELFELFCSLKNTLEPLEWTEYHKPHTNTDSTSYVDYQYLLNG